MSKALFGRVEMVPLKEGVLPDRILRLKDALCLNFAVVFAYVLIQNKGVPALGESVYLLHLAKEWNANFLANDWTLSGPLPSHFVFNLLLGPLTLLFPLEIVGWIGRFLCWSVILLALFQLGKHFRIPRWMIAVSILLWLYYRQSIVGGEWILGGFEAKGIAYALLFFSLNGFMHQRDVILPSILLGLAVSFHPLVGLWGAVGIGLSLVVLRYRIDAIVKAGCYTALFALPGLVPLLITPLGNGPDSSEGWRFVALVVMPYHFDPFSFKPWKLFLLPVLLCFNWFHFMSERKNRALQFLMTFQAFLALFFVFGFLARFVDNYAILKLMPCRLFPVLLPLFFFFHLMSTLQHCRTITSGKGLVAIALLAIVTFGIPVKLVADGVKVHHREDDWRRHEEDLERALKWVAINTPSDSTIILPPWRKDSFYLSQRAQIANWWVLRFDRLTEWRKRLESLAGDLSSLTDGTEKATMRQTIQHYNDLTETDVASLVERYGAEYLVSSARYSYPVLFQSGIYNIYSLRTQGPLAKSKPEVVGAKSEASGAL